MMQTNDAQARSNRQNMMWKPKKAKEMEILAAQAAGMRNATPQELANLQAMCGGPGNAYVDAHRYLGYGPDAQGVSIKKRPVPRWLQYLRRLFFWRQSR